MVPLRVTCVYRLPHSRIGNVGGDALGLVTDHDSLASRKVIIPIATPSRFGGWAEQGLDDLLLDKRGNRPGSIRAQKAP